MRNIKSVYIISRYLLIVFLIIFYVFVGYIRYYYIFDFKQKNIGLKKRSQVLTVKQNQIGEIIEDKRAASFVIYAGILIGLTILINYLIFLKRKYIFISLSIYCILLTILILSFAFYAMYPSAQPLYNLVIKLKNFIQDPILTVLILAYSYYDYKQSS